MDAKPVPITPHIGRKSAVLLVVPGRRLGNTSQMPVKTRLFDTIMSGPKLRPGIDGGLKETPQRRRIDDEAYRFDYTPALEGIGVLSGQNQGVMMGPTSGSDVYRDNRYGRQS